MNKSTFPLVITAFCTAIIAVLAQISIPLPLIPITGQTLAVGLVVTILGKKYGTLSVILYVCLGTLGLPVFQAFTGGLGIVFGPTGGYIIGFIPSAIAIGWYLEKYGFTLKAAVIANVVGMIITLVIGATWLKFIANLSWNQALLSGITPFIIVGFVKAIIAAYVGVIIRKRLYSAKLLQKLAH